MLFYFKLQFKRLYRTAKDNQSNFYFAALVSLVLMAVIGMLTIQKLSYGAELVSAISFIILFSLHRKKHLDFLSFHFDQKTTIKIKLIESLIITVPFSMLLFIHFEWILALSTILFGILLAIAPRPNIESKPIPTPFNNRPFEYVIGFRRYWPILAALYAFAIIGFSVLNYNLVVVVFLLVTVSQLTYFKDEEPKEWIWIYQQKPSQFLFKKIKVAFLQSTLIGAPIAITLLVMSPHYWIIVCSIMTFGVLTLTLAILIKYAYYPNVNSIVGSIYITISILVPPVLMLSIPYFFKIAKENQIDLLDD